MFQAQLRDMGLSVSFLKEAAVGVMRSGVFKHFRGGSVSRCPGASCTDQGAPGWAGGMSVGARGSQGHVLPRRLAGNALFHPGAFFTR